MKRCFDLILGIVVLVVLLPVFIIIGISIKMTSKGSIFFLQYRIGKNKNKFTIIKFRTMYIEAPRDIPTHKFENSKDYITSIGNFLRKTSLDELPQLINIIKGEMSFVGPRPALYNQYDLINLRDIEGVNIVIPGITGWAQVNGRDELPIEQKVEYDKYYVKNYSFAFDLKILLITIFHVAQAKDVVEGKQHSL